jgi:3-isopropylmalate/(R)-2-methylmalate dehydratase small subunit
VSAQPIVGRVVRLGDDVNTDLVLAGAYLNETDPATLGSHLLERYEPAVADRIVPGTILLAGRSFGAGSSREQAVLAILARRVVAVVASSYARIFFRNAVNLALPAVECPAAWSEASDGDELSIDLGAGAITRADGTVWRFPLFAPFVAELIAIGGLEAWTRRRLARPVHRQAPSDLASLRRGDYEQGPRS